MNRLGNYLLARMTFKRLIILIVLTLFALPILKSVFFGKSDEYNEGQYSYKYQKGNIDSDNKILEVGIEGMILTESAQGTNPLDILNNEGVTYGYDVKDELYRAADDPSIKGVLLQVNSPGGTIAGSKAIADGIEYYRSKTHRPIYAHIRDVGASGAYWASIVADKVYADTGTMVGSIGVIMGPFSYYNNIIQEGGLLNSVTTEGGIEHTYLTAGQYKDTGSPYRQMTPEEKAHWQTSLDNQYNIFVNHVSKYRKISPATIRDIIKALPYENDRALTLNLIDATGSEEDVIRVLLTKAKLSSSDYQLIYETRHGGIISQIFGVVSKNPKPQASLLMQELVNTPLYLYARNY